MEDVVPKGTKVTVQSSYLIRALLGVPVSKTVPSSHFPLHFKALSTDIHSWGPLQQDHYSESIYISDFQPWQDTTVKWENSKYSENLGSTPEQRN